MKRYRASKGREAVLRRRLILQLVSSRTSMIQLAKISFISLCSSRLGTGERIGMININDFGPEYIEATGAIEVTGWNGVNIFVSRSC